MADKQGVLGAQTEPSDASSPLAPGRDDREAYEEDWYRSLRALAERQQHLADRDDEPDVDRDEEPSGPELLDRVDEPATLESIESEPSHEEDHPATSYDEPAEGPADAFAPPTAGEPQFTPTDGVGDGAVSTDHPAPTEAASGKAVDFPGPVDDETPARDWPEPHLRIVSAVETVGDPGETDPPDRSFEPAADDVAQDLGAAVPSAAAAGVVVDDAGEPMADKVAPTWPDQPAADVVAPAGAEAPGDDEVPRELGPVEGAFVEPGSSETPPADDGELGWAEPSDQDRTDAGEPVGPSLISTDPNERSLALQELAAGELSEADTHRVEAMLLDPEAEIRRLGLDTLARRPDRVDEGAIWQAMQDPTDGVQAAAVGLAANRRDVSQVSALLGARDWPQTQGAVLRALPGIVAETPLDDQTLRRVLDAVGELETPLTDEEGSAIARLALGVGSRRVLDALTWPDVPRLGAIRLLAHDRSPVALRELASHRGDPLEEIAQVAERAGDELAEAEAARNRVTAAPAEQPADGTVARPAGPGLAPSEEESDRITSLARALLDEDATVRHLALSGLAGMDRSSIATWVRDAISTGDPSQLPLAASTAQMLRLVEGAANILDAAAELSADARHGFIEALASFLMPPEQLAGLLSHVREPHQASAIRMLWQVGGPPLLPHLRPYLDAPSAPVRQAVLDVFAESGDPSLLDPSAIVRRAATGALGRPRDPAAAKALGKALGDPDPEVRIGVVRALGVIDDEAVLGFLVSALNDPDPRVRDVTSQVLTEWSSPAVARRLAGVLAVPRLREAATDLLTRIGAPAVELLIDVLMQHNPAVVPTVGELLGRIARPDELLSRLDAVEPERRLRGVEALGAIGGPEAADALVRSVADPDERIRARAAQLLPGLGDPRAEDALIGLLRDPIPAVVAAAQEALTRLSAG